MSGRHFSRAERYEEESRAPKKPERIALKAGAATVGILAVTLCAIGTVVSCTSSLSKRTGPIGASASKADLPPSALPRVAAEPPPKKMSDANGETALGSTLEFNFAVPTEMQTGGLEDVQHCQALLNIEPTDPFTWNVTPVTEGGNGQPVTATMYRAAAEGSEYNPSSTVPILNVPVNSVVEDVVVDEGSLTIICNGGMRVTTPAPSLQRTIALMANAGPEAKYIRVVNMGCELKVCPKLQKVAEQAEKAKEEIIAVLPEAAVDRTASAMSSAGSLFNSMLSYVPWVGGDDEPESSDEPKVKTDSGPRRAKIELPEPGSYFTEQELASGQSGLIWKIAH